MSIPNGLYFSSEWNMPLRRALHFPRHVPLSVWLPIVYSRYTTKIQQAVRQSPSGRGAARGGEGGRDRGGGVVAGGRGKFTLAFFVESQSGTSKITLFYLRSSTEPCATQQAYGSRTWFSVHAPVCHNTDHSVTKTKDGLSSAESPSPPE